MRGITRGFQMIFDYFVWLEKNLDNPRALEPAKAWVEDLMAVRGAVVRGKVQDAILFALLTKDPFQTSRAVFHDVTGK